MRNKASALDELRAMCRSINRAMCMEVCPATNTNKNKTYRFMLLFRTPR
eukprot:CAMPEP_0204291784 /NCGR_PEP_ID=MMETSP0468-20130131/63167_1 /ASSEMBLY_ACC=CAM_ASM_000383 /TAXON_ID=2969 /ORGANISM="Oxyrrhis marina" /LENGTH=48 /DNA_ID= /DNA_START= /DNA_END= /DNA_ORIENTATION=